MFMYHMDWKLSILSAKGEMEESASLSIMLANVSPLLLMQQNLTEYNIFRGDFCLRFAVCNYSCVVLHGVPLFAYAMEEDCPSRLTLN